MEYGWSVSPIYTPTETV